MAAIRILFCLMILLVSGRSYGADSLWVLIIGISDYQYFEPLQFADDDARSFYDFIKANYKEKIDESDEGNIRLLLNEDATGAAITSSFSWLIRSAKPGDEAIIYFSGHGAQEYITSFKLGYLVGHDCYNYSYSNGGTMPMFYLQKMLETLSINDVTTYFFADACHAGKKDGEEEETLEHLNSVLSGRIEKITKVLSAQGEELSYENERWGGGHGIFTYYLIKGLIGEADTDPVDNFIMARELNQYLDSKIPKETNYLQNPLIISPNRNTRIVEIIPDRLNDIRERFNYDDSNRSQDNPFVARGISDEYIEDEGLLARYLAFKDLIRANQTVRAFNQFDTIKQYVEDNPQTISEYRKVRPNIIEKLYIAGMNYTQLYINQFMEDDHFDVRQIDIKKEDALVFMASLVDEIPRNDFRYNQIKTREDFFRTEVLHDSFHTGSSNTDELIDLLETLKKNLELDSTAAYLPYQIGVLSYHLDHLDQAYAYTQRSIALAPNWSYPYNNLGNILVRLGRKEEAIEAYRKGLNFSDKIDVTLLDNIAMVYQNNGEMDSALYYMELVIARDFERNELTGSIIDSLWNEYYMVGRLDERDQVDLLRSDYYSIVRLDQQYWEQISFYYQREFSIYGSQVHHRKALKYLLLADQYYDLLHILDPSTYEEVFADHIILLLELQAAISDDDPEGAMLPFYAYKFHYLNENVKKANRVFKKTKDNQQQELMIRFNSLFDQE